MEAASTKPLTLAWRPGGRQIMAYNGPTNRLYVLMHKGEFWTHKESGEELWEVDVTKRKVLRRYPLENHAQSVAVSSITVTILF